MERMQERIQKIISASGMMSRRSAEKLISEGKVFVNGIPALLGEKADPETDVITVNGTKLCKHNFDNYIYLMLNKPKGYVTTVSDEQGRRTVMELIKDVPGRVYPVGRLDMYSEGLLLFTNDGELANRLMHPSGETVKTYRVSVNGEEFAHASVIMRRPIEIDGYMTRPADVKLIEEKDGTAKYEISIHEGRNRQVRRICENAGLKVTRLIRISEGPLELGGLKKGCWRYLEPEEIELLRGEYNA